MPAETQRSAESCPSSEAKRGRGAGRRRHHGASVKAVEPTSEPIPQIKGIETLIRMARGNPCLTIRYGEKAATPAPAQNLNLDDLRVKRSRQ